MKIFLYLILLMLSIKLEVNAQLPNPIRYYPLDNGSVKEIINRKDGVLHGSITSYPNRFGHENYAMALPADVYISTPGFFEGTTYQNGFTISFWTYISTNFPKRKGVTPWLTTDPIHRIFYANDSRQKTMLGFYYRGDRAVVDRYVLNAQTSEIGNYGMWFWDPINFTERIGWYQVVIVYQKNNARIFLFSPDGRMEYAMHYLGLQNLASVRDWGLGGSGKGKRILDDFKIYNQPLTKAQVIELHANESVPDGMYIVSSAFNSKQTWQTVNSATSVGTLIDVSDDQRVGAESTKQWVAEPIGPHYSNLCRIRLAYTDRYLAIEESPSTTGITYLDLVDGNVKWKVEMAGDGYYFIRSEKRPDLFLKSVARPFSSIRKLEVTTYNSAEAPLYKWKLNLLKFGYDLKKDLFKTNIAYEVVDNTNTSFGMVPIRPFTKEGSPLIVDRDIYPSLSNHYTFKKSIDDSYIIYNKSFPTKALHPTNLKYTSGEPVELYEWHSAWADNYKFIVERPNPLGRRYSIKPAFAQNVSVYSGNYPTKANILFKNLGEGLADGHYWQLFADYGKLNQNKQISTLEPGIYKITTIFNENYSLRPQTHSFQTGNNIVLGQFNEGHRSSFYWIIDYEKDQSGEPVRDGTYTMQLYGTDAIYLGSQDKLTPEGSSPKSINMDRDNFSLSKWFITPTRDGTGTFYIQSASDKLKYLHLKSNLVREDNPVEYYYMRAQEEQKSYKWKFERVNIPTPLKPGTYHISIVSPHTTFYVHTRNNVTLNYSPLELGELQQSGTYKWIVELNPDKSYAIRTSSTQERRYIHTHNNSVEASATLEIKSYDKTQAHTYKWFVVPTHEEGIYYLELVGNPESGFMHLFGHNMFIGTPLEIYRYVDAVDFTYRWKFEWLYIMPPSIKK